MFAGDLFTAGGGDGAPSHAPSVSLGLRVRRTQPMRARGRERGPLSATAPVLPPLQPILRSTRRELKDVIVCALSLSVCVCVCACVDDCAHESAPTKAPPSHMADHVLAENARSVAHRELPPPPEGLPPNAASLVLFYQYVEPPWTDAEHKDALKQVIAICEQHSIKGRGRCAREGLNCTLTGTAASLRAFCNGLRSWRPALFNHTDFKITDGVEPQYAFKALTIQKKDELVAYGLPSDVAPVLKTSRARHVEADEYHKLMEEKDTVIVDVRNFYETSIGRFNPPEGGAKLIDPQLRNSHEFPKWLNAPETKAQLHGKKVLMYCTGGIRCERASALLDALTAIPSESGLETKDVVMVRGGIERYMKTFPAGGYWKGKNYLFDRRQEQVPEAKSIAALAADCDSCCSACHEPCASYRGQYTCAGRLPTSVCKAGICKVPVIVCASCHQVQGLNTCPSHSQLAPPLSFTAGRPRPRASAVPAVRARIRASDREARPLQATGNRQASARIA